MKLYRHLAWDGIRKNSRLYVPYLLTGVGAVSFFYILVALPGSGSVQVILNLGSFVLWVFSLLLLFYTHSFLIRRRNREFALYNVLGMGKGDISRILCWESLLSGGLSLLGGLALGVVLSKLAELGLMRVMGLEADMTSRVSAGGLLMALGLYGAIYLLILLSDIDGLYTADPHTHPEAALLHHVARVDDHIREIAGISSSTQGTGGMVTKLHAADICLGCGCKMVIANGNNPGNLYDILEGKTVGTTFSEERL